MHSNNLTLTTYNTSGFGYFRSDYVRDLLLTNDILCIQEHFQLEANLPKLSVSDHHDVIAISAVSPMILSSGRPKGGLATFVRRSSFSKYASIPSNSFRINASLLWSSNSEFSEFKILVINLYLPVNADNENTISELCVILAEVSQIIDSNAFDLLFIPGDMNCDFSRQS